MGIQALDPFSVPKKHYDHVRKDLWDRKDELSPNAKENNEKLHQTGYC